MDTTKATAVLFDFDGVVVDTETQYSHFWHEMGKQYLGMDDIEGRVKGQTLVYIYDTFFPGMAKEQAEITERLNRFEQEMSFDFIPGVLDFIADLHRNGVKTAVVTSSNEAKMAAVYRVLGLATTNSREDIAPLCHYVLDDFQGFTYDKLTQLYK